MKLSIAGYRSEVYAVGVQYGTREVFIRVPLSTGGLEDRFAPVNTVNYSPLLAEAQKFSELLKEKHPDTCPDLETFWWSLSAAEKCDVLSDLLRSKSKFDNNLKNDAQLSKRKEKALSFVTQLVLRLDIAAEALQWYAQQENGQKAREAIELIAQTEDISSDEK